MLKALAISSVLTVWVLVILRNVYWYDSAEAFDAKAFVIVLTFAFGLFYKFIRWAIVLKREQGKSTGEIIFLANFFILLFVPMLKINRDVVSAQEHRALASHTHLIADGRINRDFGRQFDAWFNDRFFGRGVLISFYNELVFRASGRQENAVAMMGGDKWLFTKQYNAEKMFMNDNLFTDRQLARIKEKFDALQAYADKNGIKLYIFLSSDKESIYENFYPDRYEKRGPVSRLDQLKDFLSKNVKAKVISPRENIMREVENGEIVFCKTGTHMSNIGAYTEYRTLTEALKKDIAGISVLTPSDFDITETQKCDVDILRSLGIKYTMDTKYKAFRLKDPEAKPVFSEISLKARGAILSRFGNPARKGRIFLVGDSFSSEYIAWLAEHFNETYQFFIGTGEQDFMLEAEEARVARENRPDVIVIQSTERLLDRFQTIPTEF